MHCHSIRFSYGAKTTTKRKQNERPKATAQEKANETKRKTKRKTKRNERPELLLRLRQTLGPTLKLWPGMQGQECNRTAGTTPTKRTTKRTPQSYVSNEGN